MKPFNLEAAKAGAPVITRDGNTSYKYSRSSENDIFHYFRNNFMDRDICVNSNGHTTGVDDGDDFFMLEDFSTETNTFDKHPTNGIGLDKSESSNNFYENIEEADINYERGYKEGFTAGLQEEDRESKIKEWAALFIAGSMRSINTSESYSILDTGLAIRIATELYETKIEEQ